MKLIQRILLPVCLLLITFSNSVRADDSQFLEFGFSRLDVIPEIPIRLSGYNERDKPYEEVQDIIYVRTMVIRQESEKLYALVALESIGFPGELTTKISRELEKKYSIPRHRFVLTSTHTHAGPQVEGFAPNLYREELSEEEKKNIHKYSLLLEKRVIDSVGKAIDDLAPGTISFAEGKTGFAGNRRKLKDGKCVAMAFNPEGVVDHSVPVLKILSPEGNIRGIIFNYACHCVTLTGAFNNISGDWAGLASGYLEEIYPGSTALCTIGCGADANSEPRGTYDMALGHGRTMATEVKRVLSEEMNPISVNLKSSFGYAGLPVDFPPMSKFELDAKSENVHVRRRAEFMQETFEKKGRLPESYPMPLQIWNFGSDLKMVFMGGEVVADYALRLKKSLNAENVWVTAYANDVFGYVPSERMIEEGGYEVDYSMLFYNHPGPWKSGTEEIIINRIGEIDQAETQESALAPEEAIKSFLLQEGFEIELVASEPLIADPVNFSFGIDGKLWVTQMSDYPLGDSNGNPSGVVQFLEDTDQDGVFDKGTVFLDKIDYPTGAVPWKKGVLISSASQIIYAEDRNGDGQADFQEVLYSGFDPSNSQHLINGFIYGLDHWLHLGSGTYQRKIKSEKTGTTVDASGRDMKIQPDTGEIELISGLTQFGRARNDWGDWFGNSNSEPLFHFVISDRYLRRNPYYAGINPKVYVTPLADQIYPASRVIARFNDLHSASRFTSACSPAIFRDETLGSDYEGMGLTCEPVHNLISRRHLERKGIPYEGTRFAEDEGTELIRSTDVWSRPVRVETGPDGALWFADMYRYVIEHPQWIPEEWQKQLDLKAGYDKGRIYRVYRKENKPEAIPDLSQLSSDKLVEKLSSKNGTLRDLIQKTLIQRDDKEIILQLETLVKTSQAPEERIHALCILSGMNHLEKEVLISAIKDKDWRIQRMALRLSENRIQEEKEILDTILTLENNPEPALTYQLALTLGESTSPEAGKALGKIAVENHDNEWIRAALLSSALEHADQVLTALLSSPESNANWSTMVSSLIETVLGKSENKTIEPVLKKIMAGSGEEIEIWQISAMISFLDALSKSNLTLKELMESSPTEQKALINSSEVLFRKARENLDDDQVSLPDKIQSAGLLGQGPSGTEEDLATLVHLLSPQVPPELQNEAVRTLGKISRPEIPDLLLQQWRTYSSNLQGKILTLLSRRADWSLKLLDSIEKGDVLVVDLDAGSRSQLLKSQNQEIRERSEKLFESAGSQDRKAVIEEYAKVNELKGNLIRGASLFKKHCTSCHKFRERGNEFGANLAVLSDKSTGNLLVSILDPNRAVEKKFFNYQVVTRNGKIYSGMSYAMSSTSITLVSPDGKKETILRNDIEDYLNTGKSFMPDGLEKDISPEAMADIIAFIQSSPVPTPSIDLEMVSDLKKQLESAGMNGLGELQTGHAKKSLKTWLGEVEVIYCSSEEPGSKLIWNSMPLSTVVKPGPDRKFLIPVVMGGFEDQEKQNFQFHVNDQAQIDLNVTKGDSYWASEDSQYQIQFTAVQSDTDYVSGFFEVTVPVTASQLGKPVRFSIISKSSGKGWIGIIPQN